MPGRVAVVDKDALKSSLQAGLRELNLDVSDEQVMQLLDYLELLVRWNSAFNLSGVKNPATMISRHLLDSLAISPFIDGEMILDAGTGAGLPGIPLAILHPEKQFVLLDSNGKKTRFLFQAKLALNLANITIENTRLEDYQCPPQIDIVVCRAFSSLSRMAQVCAAVVKGKCRLLAMKGNYPLAEIEELPAEFEIAAASEMTVPGQDGVRHLIEISLHPGNAVKSALT